MPGAAGFFHLLSPVPAQIANVHKQFADIRELLGTVRAPVAGQLITRVEAAYLEFTTGLDGLSAQLARQAQELLLQKYDKTRVRPDTGQSPHLRDVLHAMPVRTSLPTGTVGIGDVEELDQVPYWKAQEFGLSEGFVGRTLTGYFFGAGGAGGGYAADPALSRVHPLFRVIGGGFAPHMTIGNAIQPGHFLSDTALEIAGAWLAAYGRIERRAVTQLAQVSAVLQAEIEALAVGEKL